MSLASVLVIEGEGAQVLPEGPGQRVGGGVARRLVRLLKLVQRRLQRKLLAADFELQFGHRLVEKAVPGAAAGHGLLVKELLDAVLELVRLVHAQVDDPRAVAAGLPVGLHGPVDDRVVDAVQFQFEEEQTGTGVGHLRLGVAVELGIRRICRVGEIGEAGIRHQAAHDVLQRLVLGDRRSERAGPRGVLEAALPALLEFDGLALDAREVGRQLRRTAAGIKIVEVPSGQVAQRRCAGRADGRQDGVDRGVAVSRHHKPLRSAAVAAAPA